MTQAFQSGQVNFVAAQVESKALHFERQRGIGLMTKHKFKGQNKW